MDKKYKRICDKLGFIPSDYKHPETDGGDDRQENPFLVLTPDEINYLYKNGYLTQKKKD